MNYTILHNVKDLNAILLEPPLITGDTRLHEKETEHNMWALALVDTRPLPITQGMLISFVMSLRKSIKEQLKNNNMSSSVTFYMWFDEMVGQLRFNVVSGQVKQLPFGCHVEKITSPEQIVEAFLSSPYLHSIPLDELEIDTHVDDHDEDDDEYTLPVYVEYITYS